MKRFVGRILLVAFVLISCPKEVWHNHEVANDSQIALELEDSLCLEFHSDDCSYCNFDLSQALVPFGFQVAKMPKTEFAFQPKNVAHVDVDPTTKKPVRGPPVEYLS